MQTRDLATLNSGLQRACYEQLQQLRESLSELDMAVITTEDGFPIATLDSSRLHHRRAAAMAAALSGLCHSITQELNSGVLEGTVLECEQGLIFCRQVVTPKRTLVLLAMVGSNVVYGHALWAIRNTSRDLTAALLDLAHAKSNSSKEN